jgi:hypothetical protein
LQFSVENKIQWKIIFPERGNRALKAEQEEMGYGCGHHVCGLVGSGPGLSCGADMSASHIK